MKCETTFCDGVLIINKMIHNSLDNISQTNQPISIQLVGIVLFNV